MADGDLDLISEDSWRNITDIHKFLKPFDYATTAMSGSTYPTMAAVIPLFNRLCDHLDVTIKYNGNRNHLNKVRLRRL
jgi:hypothetical protein